MYERRALHNRHHLLLLSLSIRLYDHCVSCHTSSSYKSAVYFCSSTAKNQRWCSSVTPSWCAQRSSSSPLVQNVLFDFCVLSFHNSSGFHKRWDIVKAFLRFLPSFTIHPCAHRSARAPPVVWVLLHFCAFFWIFHVLTDSWILQKCVYIFSSFIWWDRDRISS